MKFFLKGDLNMRLYNVYYVCKSELEYIEGLNVQVENNGTRRIISWIPYKKPYKI